MVQSFGKKMMRKTRGCWREKARHIFALLGMFYLRPRHTIWEPGTGCKWVSSVFYKIINEKTKKKNIKKVGTQVLFFQHDQIFDLRWPDNKKEDGKIKSIIDYSHTVP